MKPSGYAKFILTIQLVTAAVCVRSTGDQQNESMKNIIIILLLLFISNVMYAQYQPDRSYYLHKSKQQKTFATISLVTGGAVAVAGGYIWFISPVAGLSESGDIDGARHLGQTLVAVGGGLAALSIPLYISGAKNKKKADLYVGTSQVTYLPQGIARQVSLGFKIEL